MKIAVAVLLVVLCACSGMRIGWFAGVYEGSSDFEGTSSPISQSGGGVFFGVQGSTEVTSASPPRRAPLLRALDPEKEEVDTPGEGVDFDPRTNPIALLTYAISTVLAAFVSKLLQGKTQ